MFCGDQLTSGEFVFEDKASECSDVDALWQYVDEEADTIYFSGTQDLRYSCFLGAGFTTDEWDDTYGSFEDYESYSEYAGAIEFGITKTIPALRMSSDMMFDFEWDGTQCLQVSP